MKIIFYLALCVCLLRCNSSEHSRRHGAAPQVAEINGGTPGTVELDMDVDGDNRISLHALLKPIDIIPLETSPASFISNIKRIAKVDSFLIVLDDSLDKLLLFDADGRFIRMIGSKGHGPGEYVDVADFCFDEKRSVILVLSTEKRSIYEYSISGNHLRTLPLPFQSGAISMLGDDQLANYVGYCDEDNKNLKITDRDAEQVLYTGFEFPESMYAMNLLAVTGHLTGNSVGCHYSDATSSYIHQIRYDGSSYPKYYIDFGDSFWPEGRRYDVKSFFENIQSGQLNFLTNYYEENDHALVFRYNHGMLAGSKKVVQFFNAYFVKSGNRLYTHKNIKIDLLSSILSGPVGLTLNNHFISVIRIEDYKFNAEKSPEGVSIPAMDSVLRRSEWETIQ